MAIDDIGGSDGGDAQPVPLGVRVTLANTPDKIRALLPNGGRGWLLQKTSEYSSFLLRASRTTKIFKRKSAKEMTHATRADGDTVMVFVLANTNGDTSGGGNNVDSDSMSGLSDVEKLTIAMATKSAAMAAFYQSGKSAVRAPYLAGLNEEETNEQSEPTINIINPKPGASVIRGLRGISIDGSSSQTDSVALAWKSTSSGNESITSNGSWDGILSLDPDEHELTATNAGVSHTVKFTVILNPAITGYTAEDIQLINSFKSGSYNKSDEAQLVQALAREAGLVDKDDDFSDTTTGKNVVDKVKAFASNAKGDFNLYYSGSGDKAFIEKKLHISLVHI